MFRQSLQLFADRNVATAQHISSTFHSPLKHQIIKIVHWEENYISASDLQNFCFFCMFRVQSLSLVLVVPSLWFCHKTAMPQQPFFSTFN